MDLRLSIDRLGPLFLIVVRLLVLPADTFGSTTVDPESVLSNARRTALTWRSDEAVRQFTEAANLFAAAGNGDRSARSLLMAAETAYAAGEQVRAKALVEGVLSGPAPLDPDTRIVANSILVLISYQTGKKEDAERWLRNSQSLITSGTSGEASAYFHFSSGIYEYFYGDVRKASASFENAVRLTAGSEEGLIPTRSLFYLGNSQLRLGNTLLAMDRMQEALARSQRMGYERGIALSNREIGYIHFHLGELQIALDSFRTVQQMLPATGAVVEQARVLNAIGLVYRDLGDLESAERYFENAEEAFVLAGYPLGALTALLNLSDLYTRSSENDRARESYLLAQERARELGDEFQMALAAEGLGKLELNSKNFDRSIGHFKAALAMTKMSGTDSNTISELLGAAYELKGDLKNARSQYNSVLAINERVGNTVYRAKNLFDLARIDYLEGKFQASRARMLESLQLTETVYASVDSSNLRRSYLGQSHYRFKLMTALAARDAYSSQRPEDIELALKYLEKARSRSLSEDLRLTQAGVSAEADQALITRERYLLTSLTAKTDRLTNMRLGNRHDPDVSVVESEISEILEELDEVSTVQKRQDPLYSSIRHPPDFELAHLRHKVLGNNEVLVAYFLGESESYVWVADRDNLDLFQLPPGGLIDQAVDSVNARLQTRASVNDLPIEKRAESIRIADAEYAAEARGLSNMILGPVADKIRGKRLIVIPDGKLNYFPISALPMPNSGSDDPLLLTNEVMYEPSLQTYELLKTVGRKRKGVPSKALLVFSDPIFNSADDRLTGLEAVAETTHDPRGLFRFVESFRELSRLSASKTEAETVSSVVGGSDLFMGFEATRERLLSTNLADYRVVHLATHGFLDPERPELSSLIFSRYDQAGRKIDESIRLHDIYSMKFNADLVVLSACQTGTGKEVKGEGVMGLDTAFLHAGARSVVSTLWQVEDNAANQLMKEFYGRMVSDGMSPSAALRAAQIKLYRDPQFRSPFFWAAFTVHGDAASSIPFERDRTRLVAGIAAFTVVAGIIGFLLLCRRRYRTSNA